MDGEDDQEWMGYLDFPEDEADHGQPDIVSSEASQPERKRNEAVGDNDMTRLGYFNFPEDKADNEQPGVVLSSQEQKQKREKAKVISWTEFEHQMFLLGLEIFDFERKWKAISTWLLPSKTPSQIGSHAQKFFLRKEHKDERQRKSINDMMSLTEEDRQNLCAMLWENLQARQQQQQPQPPLQLSTEELKISAFVWKRLQAQQQQQPLEPLGAAPTMQFHESQFHQVPEVAFPGHERHHLHQMPVMGAAASLTAPRPSPPTWNGMPPDTDHVEEMQGMNINMAFAREEDNLKLLQAAPTMVHYSNASQVHRVPASQERERKESTGEEEQKRKRTNVGSWTADEHKMFLYGLELFERSWETISKYLLPNKTPSQIESHAQQYFDTEEWQRKSDTGILQEEDKEKARALIWRRLDALQEQQQPLEQAQAVPTEAQSRAAQLHQIPGVCFPGHERKFRLHQMPVMGAVSTLAAPRPRPPTWNQLPNTPIGYNAEERQRKSTDFTCVREEDELRLPQTAPAMVQSQVGPVHQGVHFPGQRQPEPRHHLHQAPMMGALTAPTPCYIYGQMQFAAPATWNMPLNTPNGHLQETHSSYPCGGPAVIPRLAPYAPVPARASLGQHFAGSTTKMQYWHNSSSFD